MSRNLIRLFKEADYLHCFLEIDEGFYPDFFFDHIDSKDHGVDPNRFYSYLLTDEVILVLK